MLQQNTGLFSERSVWGRKAYLSVVGAALVASQNMLVPFVFVSVVNVFASSSSASMNGRGRWRGHVGVATPVHACATT